MTNQQAFEVNGDATKSVPVLTIYGIEPSESDRNRLSYAYGIISRVQESDKRVGNTSESLSASARGYLLSEAELIFADQKVSNPFASSEPAVKPISWP